MSMAQRQRGWERAQTPYASEHERSVERKARTMVKLRDLLREFREACEAEHPDHLHRTGVESEQGATSRQIADAIVHARPLPKVPDAGGSHLGGPRWSHEFRSYIDAGASPFATYVDDHGEEQWAYPLRSAIRRMELSSKGDRIAARFCYLLRRCNGHHREAWAAQLGPFVDPDIIDAADWHAAECLRRWYMHYSERPRGKSLA